MTTLADMRDEGKTIQETYDWIMHNRLCMHHWFCSTDLTFYVKGGPCDQGGRLVRHGAAHLPGAEHG